MLCRSLFLRIYHLVVNGSVLRMQRYSADKDLSKESTNPRPSERDDPGEGASMYPCVIMKFHTAVGRRECSSACMHNHHVISPSVSCILSIVGK